MSHRIFLCCILLAAVWPYCSVSHVLVSEGSYQIIGNEWLTRMDMPEPGGYATHEIWKEGSKILEIIGRETDELWDTVHTGLKETSPSVAEDVNLMAGKSDTGENVMVPSNVTWKWRKSF